MVRVMVGVEVWSEVRLRSMLLRILFWGLNPAPCDGRSRNPYVNVLIDKRLQSLPRKIKYWDVPLQRKSQFGVVDLKNWIASMSHSWRPLSEA